MKKLLNKKGFTLMEMLIVVAIIVILVAISIPTFSGSLNSSKEAADKANLRSAKAAVALMTAEGQTVTDGMVYHIETGAFDTNAATDSDKGQCETHTDAYITIVSGQAIWSDGSTDCGQ